MHLGSLGNLRIYVAIYVSAVGEVASLLVLDIRFAWHPLKLPTHMPMPVLAYLPIMFSIPTLLISISPRQVSVLHVRQEVPAARHPVHHQKDVEDNLSGDLNKRKCCGPTHES